jgi:hypothetical protein
MVFEPTIPTSELLQTHALGYGYIEARTDPTQHSSLVRLLITQ